MSTTENAIDPDLWKAVEATIVERYPESVERDLRLQLERARLASLPTTIDISVKVTNPLAIWRMIQFAEECQLQVGDGETMLVLQKIMPKVVSWGLEAAHANLTSARKKLNPAPHKGESRTEP